ncbi:MAG: hypothetical protein M1546_15615 [Chloroflexi bacterium]|nr:hypothetical protein [Chloroflexota bacterium]
MNTGTTKLTTLTTITTITTRTLALQQAGLFAVALLLLLGHLMPWAAHKTAALTLSAHELATFTNYTPGAGIFLNEWFYLPLWAAALLFALFASVTPSLAYRVMGGLLGAGIASLGLPGYPQVLTAFSNADVQLQFFISLATMLAAVALALSGLGRRPGVRTVLGLVLGLLPAVPLAGYLAIKPFIEQLYRDPVGLGLGWWLMLAALLLTPCLVVIVRWPIRRVDASY